MQMDRNLNPDGRGKYALIRLRDGDPKAVRIDGEDCWATPRGSIDFGKVGAADEFFVIKLKDKYAQAALMAYADAARADDPEWAGEVEVLAMRSGPSHPLCERPD